MTRSSLQSAQHRALVSALVSRRKHLGLSQRALAARMRVSQSLVAQVESCQRRVGVVELLWFAAALRVKPEVLLKAAQKG